MTPIERNPDVNLESEELPAGMTLIRGKNLMQMARAKHIPFGVATAGRWVTIGLVIRDEDVARFTAALAAKAAQVKLTGRGE